MYTEQDPISTLTDIKTMMEKSSRFISLSGLSGVAAGVIALIGAYLAYGDVTLNPDDFITASAVPIKDLMKIHLIYIALGTLIASIIAGFIFTYLKVKKLNQPIWDQSSRRLLINLGLPLLVGGLFILKMIHIGYISMIAPACLIFYGLALVHASKYTLGDIRYLGYIEIALGLINMTILDKGLYFWAMGFGVAHILYGIFMWNKYDNVKV